MEKKNSTVDKLMKVHSVNHDKKDYGYYREYDPYTKESHDVRCRD